MKSELRYDIVCAEEGIHRLGKRIDSAFLRVSVDDAHFLQDQSREGLEMDLLEFYISIKLVVQPVYDLACHISLHLRELDYQHARYEQ